MMLLSYVSCFCAGFVTVVSIINFEEGNIKLALMAAIAAIGNISGVAFAVYVHGV